MTLRAAFRPLSAHVRFRTERVNRDVCGILPIGRLPSAHDAPPCHFDTLSSNKMPIAHTVGATTISTSAAKSIRNMEHQNVRAG